MGSDGMLDKAGDLPHQHMAWAEANPRWVARGVAVAGWQWDGWIGEVIAVILVPNRVCVVAVAGWQWG
jgi:hypothetical protein